MFIQQTTVIKTNQCEIQINVEHSTINIQHQPTMDVEQLSRMDIQQSTNVEEENVNQSISVNSNDTNRKRKLKNSNINKVFIKSGKTNIECIKKRIL